MPGLDLSILNPTTKHTASLIFLHGLGGNGHNWLSKLAEVHFDYMKIICPSANSIPVTREGEMMPAWFDIKGIIDHSVRDDEETIRRASHDIHKLIEMELNSGVDANRILLGGFSQGGALSLYAGLSCRHTLGGIICSSGWLPLYKELKSWKQINSDQMPIIMLHGDSDTRVPYSFGQLSADTLMELMKNVEFRTYPGGEHTMTEEQLLTVKEFVEKCLSKQRFSMGK